MDCPARYRALPFEWTVGKRGSDGRFLQKSWPVNFEGIPASAGAPSNHEADAGLPATYFSRIKCRPGVRDSSAIQEPSKPVKEEKFPVTVLPASAAHVEKA